MYISGKKDKRKKFFLKIVAVIVWILIWALVAFLVNNDIILVSPGSVFKAWIEMLKTTDYYLTGLNSFKIISTGFFCGVFFGIILSILAQKIKFLEAFLEPPISFLKSAPVVSFIILLLILLRNIQYLPFWISFMIILPVIYTNSLAGLNNVDRKLLEMAKVFKVKPKQKVIYIYVSNFLPYFTAGCKIALGLCWKSGVAAEVIGLISNTIGEKMFMAKQFLNMDKLVAWIFTIILIGFLFESLIMQILKFLTRRIES